MYYLYNNITCTVFVKSFIQGRGWLPRSCNLVSLSCILSYGPLDFIFHISLLSVLGVSQATSSAAFLQSSSSTSPYLVYIKPPQAPPFFSLHLPHLPTCCISSHLKRHFSLVFILHLSLLGSSHLKRHLSLVFIFHISLLGVSQATSSATFLQSSSSTSPYLVYLKPHQAPPFFSLHLPHLPTQCISSHIKCHLSLVFIFHISLPTWCISSHLKRHLCLVFILHLSLYLEYLKPPQAPPFFSLHLPHLPTWCISSHLKRHLSLVFILHLSLLGVSQATSSATFLQSSSSTSPYLVYLKPPQAPPFFSLHLAHLPTWSISSHLKRHLSLVFIFHISLLSVSQATSSATFLQYSSSTSPYLVYLKPHQVPPFFSLHLPHPPTRCISSHLKRRLSLVFIFHISLLGVSQATSSATFLQSSSSTSPYLEYIKPPQAPPLFSLHLPHLPTQCISSHLKRHLSLVFIFHISLLGVSQATSSATFLQSSSSTSPYLEYIKPPQAPPFFSLHLPHLPTWFISSHLKRRLSLVFIFHISLLGVSQATLSATFLQSSSCTSPYLVYLKPPQAPPFFSIHLPHLPTWCLSSHLKRHLSLVFIFHISLLGVSQATSSAAFLQYSSSTSPYLLYLKPPQAPPFFSLHLPHLPTWSVSSHLKRHLSLVFIFHISLLGVSQATSSAAFLYSSSCTSPYSSHLKRHLSLVFIFHISLLGVSQAFSSTAFLQSSSSTSPYLEYLKPPQAPPFFSLHLPYLPTWSISSHLKRHLSLVFIFHISLLSVSQATSSATFLQSSSSTSPYLVSLKPPQAPPFFSLHLAHLPTWSISSHLKRRLSLVFIFHISLLGVSQATSSDTFLQSSSSTSPCLLYLKPHQVPPFFSLHLPRLPTWCISSHLKRHLSLVFILHLSLLGVSQATSSATFLQSSSSTSPYLVYLKPHQVPPFFSLHLPHLPTWCLSSHLKRRVSLVFILHISLLKPPQATPFFSILPFLLIPLSALVCGLHPCSPHVPPT